MSVVELFCGNSQRFKTVSRFRRRDPSFVFDGVQIVTLYEENISTNTVTQGNLEIPVPPNSPELHQTEKK